MKSKESLHLRLSQEGLRSNSFVIYKGVMNVLFQHYDSYDFVRELQSYFRSKRFDLALTLADSLSGQKYSDATTHFVANQFSNLVRKYPWPSELVGTNPEAAAVKKFLRSELLCKRLNRKFFLYDNFRSPYESNLSKMRSFIRYVIGESPPIESILSRCDFGAGASLGVHGNATHLAAKLLRDKWTVTPGASTYGYWAVMSNPHLRDLLLESKGSISCLDWDTSKARYSSKTQYVANNKVAFVPKTAKTHRAIAVEPLLNGFLQKGTDSLMRIFLKRVGIDLSDQSLNQRLARNGSLPDQEDPYVTIDLSSASDSISIGLVRSLLPPDWFDFLNSIRSPRYELNGKHYTYHKFCSMGNGFCFPLETLIFVSILESVGCGVAGTDYSVYGDDIIVRRSKANEVLRLLKAFGFSPNSDKTFLEGPFRESCGSDWFGGVDVRPYTLDYALDSLESLFKWLNLTRRNIMTSMFFEGTWDYILSHVPHRYRFFRPFKGDPDSGIDSWADQHLSSSNCFYDRKSYSWRCKELKHRPLSDRRSPKLAYRRDSVDMYALLSGARSEHYRVAYTFRRKTKTAVTLSSHSGATATWLPTSSAECGAWFRLHHLF